MLKEKINALIEEKKEELFSLLGALIKINSESFGHSGNEAEVAEYIAKCFSEMGLFAEVYSPLSLAGFSEHPDHFAGRGLENRYNATVRWRGRKDEDALMLMAHSDTEVIGDEKRWTVPPLCGEVRDGKIWGRGACDDKYATATVLFLVKLLRENGFVPEKNLLFTAYCDEEKGGSNGALAAMLKYPCEKTVNMDCKSFEIWNAAAGGGIGLPDRHLLARLRVHHIGVVQLSPKGSPNSGHIGLAQLGLLRLLFGSELPLLGQVGQLVDAIDLFLSDRHLFVSL